MSPRPISAFTLVASVFLLFAIWGSSFIAIEYLLKHAGLNWLDLTVARFLPVGIICALWCATAWPRDAVRLIRQRPARLVTSSAFSVLAYSFALYYAQERGVPPPIASLITTLAPLFVMLLSAAFLGERLTARRVIGFVVALGGICVIATSKDMGGATDYAWLVAIAALAPLSWSIHSVVTKPISKAVNPMMWTYSACAIALVPLIALLPLVNVDAVLAMQADGWIALAFLVLPTTVFGYALWAWLLRHLPATSVGFTVFLNPPMTTTIKYTLSVLAPASFTFAVTSGEWLGGVIALCGVAIAIVQLPKRGA